MRRISLYSLSLLTLVLAACSDSNVVEDFTPAISGHLLTISENSLRFPAEGGTKEAYVTSSQSPWNFTDIPAWVGFNPMSGKSSAGVKVTAQPYSQGDGTRTTIVYLNSTDPSWAYKEPITITQDPDKAYIEVVGSKSLDFSGAASSQEVEVKTNIEIVPTPSDDWIKPTMDDNKLIVSVDENLTDASRSGEIALVGARTEIISVVQRAAKVTGEKSTINFSNYGEQKTYSFDCETSWSTCCTADWINVTPDKGTPDVKQFTITTLSNNSPNSRKEYVYLNVGDHQKLEVPIQQEGISIQASPTSLTFTPESNSKTINVISNTTWEVVTLPDWITASAESGRETQELTLTASENPNSTSRNGEVLIGRKGQTYGAGISVRQEAMSISADYNLLQFSDKASSQSVSVTTPGTWKASPKSNWIMVSPKDGSGNTTMTVTVTENMSEDERIGDIELTAGTTTKGIKVVQAGKFFKYGDGDLTIGSTGGNLSISLETNDKWTVGSFSADWLKCDKLQGDGADELIVVVADNPSMKERSGSFVIIPENTNPIKVAVTQKGRYLTVDQTILNYFSNGGNKSLVVSTDGQIQASTSADWVAATITDGNVVKIKVERNIEQTNREAKLTISLSDLATNEEYSVGVTIRQTSMSNVIGIKDYGEDMDWNEN